MGLFSSPGASSMSAVRLLPLGHWLGVN